MTEPWNGRALPSGWAVAPFGDLVTLVNGRAYKRAELLNQGTPVLRIQNLNGGDKWFYSELKLDSDKYCEDGDLLYAWSATFGPYFYRGPRAIYHYHIWKVLVGTGITSEFCFHLLREITAEVKAAAHGVAMPHMTKAGMEAWRVPLPPLKEQQRIAAKIEALTAKSRRAKEALDAIPPLLERFRQSVLAAAFRGDLTVDWRAKNPDVEPAEELLARIRTERRARWEEAELTKMRAKGKEPKDDKWKARYKDPEPLEAAGLPELPRGWARATLDSVTLRIGYGYTASAYADRVGPRFLRITDIQANRVDWGDVPFCVCEEPGRYLLKDGDIVIARTGATTGKSYLIEELPEDAVFASYLIRCETTNAFPARLLWLYMQSAGYWKQITTVSKGTAQAGANASILSRLVVPVPPLEEMSAILATVTNTLNRVSAVSKSLMDATTVIDGLNQAVLAKAFRGELVPQDPNDEPASVLLERIRAEREKAESKKRTKRRSKQAAT